MDTEKIIQDLNRRFSEPLPEFYKRRIIFWYDEDKEFEDKLDEIQISNAKIIVLTGSNNFEVKKLLNVDDTLSNYLVYSPFLYDNLEDNWFLDIELYSEEFRADLISMWMDELKVPQTPDLRSGFKKYRKFFNAAERRNKFKALGITPSKVSQLQVAVMAVLAGTDARPNAVLKAILQNGLDMDTNSVYQDFVSYEIHSAFWNMVSQGAGYQENEPTIENLSRHLLLTASTRTMRQEFLKGLDEYISPAYQAYCYDFVSDWMHGRDSKDIFDIAASVEDDLNLPQRFNNNKNMQVSDFLDTEIFPCINEVLLVKLMNDISEHQVDVDLITRTVEKRRTCVWYDELENYFEGILVVARMQKFYKEHSFGFHTVESRKIWEEYTSDYYMMDTYYRQFHKWFSASQKKHHPELTDRFIAVKDNVEGLYINWFLKELGNKWSDACADELANYGRISDTQQQSDFYRSMVAPSNNRVYVIISDAMRYEVAASLAELLHRETKSEVKLSSVQGIFPTITKFGMAALLPHNQLSVELKQGKTERLAVLADGQSTEANNRDKLLKAKNPQSVALKYDDIINVKSAERKALVKGMDVVYIYHDVIDAAGHDEKGVFAACDEAIEELKNMENEIVGAQEKIVNLEYDMFVKITNVLSNGSTNISLADTLIDALPSGFIDKIMTFGLYFILFIPFMTTIVQILTQIFLRVVKLIFCFAFAPIPIALSVDDEGRGKAVQYFLFSASVGIEAIIIYIATNIYAIGLSGLSSTIGSTSAISTVVALLFLNGVYLAVIQYAGQFAEKLTGGH